jgi:hypothetical protein
VNLRVLHDFVVNVTRCATIGIFVMITFLLGVDLSQYNYTNVPEYAMLYLLAIFVFLNVGD